MKNNNPFINSTKKILIVGPAWVGDMIMAQTLFKLLKQNNPNVTLDVLAPKSTLPLLARIPEINKSHALLLQHGELALIQRYRLGRSLRNEKYDQAIILPNSFKSALVPFFAGIPIRTGYVGECRFGIVNDMRRLDKHITPLMIQQFAALAFSNKETLPKELPWPSLIANKDGVPTFAGITVERNKPVLALCPGAEYGPAKRWPADHFSEVAKRKLAQGWHVWILGGPKDQPVAEEIQTLTDNRCVNFTGKTSLEEAIDLLALSNAVVSNDSGLMHIACALNRPTVVIYGSSDPRFTPPLSHLAKILSLNLSCSPCFKRTCPLEHLNCLRELLPQTVIHALEDFS